MQTSNHVCTFSPDLLDGRKRNAPYQPINIRHDLTALSSKANLFPKNLLTAHAFRIACAAKHSSKAHGNVERKSVEFFDLKIIEL
jgi:hypothetical protein